jgi:hypothetical protein
LGSIGDEVKDIEAFGRETVKEETVWETQFYVEE